MSDSLTTRKMSDRHEDHVANVLNGRLSVGSGSTWRDKADGRHADSHEGDFPFAWDAKSTLAASLSVSLKTWAKIDQQAGSLLPSLALRFYADRRLTRVHEDLMLLRLETFAEVLEAADTWAAVRRSGCLEGRHNRPSPGSPCIVCGTAAR